MAKKKSTPTQHSAVRRDLRSEKYRLRVVASKTAYKRKAKHANRAVESYAKAVSANAPLFLHTASAA